MASETPTPLPGTDPKVFARFISKVNVTDGCWLWIGGGNHDGYGNFRSSAGFTAHRFAWFAFRGIIPGNLFVLHDCPGGDNRACVNPAHLWLGTQAENIADMDAKGRRIPAAGDKHGSRTCPEARPRGDEHWLRRHPERVPRGEKNRAAKLNDVVVRVIRLLASRGVPKRRLAAAYGVGWHTISHVVSGKTWGHV